MTKIKTVLLYTCNEAPKGKSLIILKDEAGWLWFWPRVKEEGYTTPFCSIEEIAAVYDLTGMRKLKESPFTPIKE